MWAKGARVMFLIVVARGGAFSFGEELPEGVVPIESPVVGIRDHLATLNANTHSMEVVVLRPGLVQKQRRIL